MVSAQGKKKEEWAAMKICELLGRRRLPKIFFQGGEGGGKVGITDETRDLGGADSFSAFRLCPPKLLSQNIFFLSGRNSFPTQSKNGQIEDQDQIQR